MHPPPGCDGGMVGSDEQALGTPRRPGARCVRKDGKPLDLILPALSKEAKRHPTSGPVE